MSRRGGQHRCACGNRIVVKHHFFRKKFYKPNKDHNLCAKCYKAQRDRDRARAMKCLEVQNEPDPGPEQP